MSGACADVLAARHLRPDDIDLVVPHQANLRIIEAVAKRAGVPMERVFVNVHRYGNMSAGTVPVALVEAIEEGRVKPNARMLLPAFGAGLTWCAHLVRWGERVTPRGHDGRRPAALRQDGARDGAGAHRARSANVPTLRFAGLRRTTRATACAASPSARRCCRSTSACCCGDSRPSSAS